MTAKGTFFPRRINAHVPNMEYAADVRFGGLGTIDIPAPVSKTDYLLVDGFSIAAAGATPVLLHDGDTGAKFGRNLTVVASGAATSNVTVRGKDYLGQPMVESFTLAGTTAVVGKKAFKYVESIDYGITASTTIDIGIGDVLGLPYRLEKEVMVLVDHASPASAGTFVAGLARGATQSATTGDPRGTWTPSAATIPDGSRSYELTAKWDVGNLHGDKHFYA